MYTLGGSESESGKVCVRDLQLCGAFSKHLRSRDDTLLAMICHGDSCLDGDGME